MRESVAMKPEALILDEPTARTGPQRTGRYPGPGGKVHAEQGMTVILVSHSMEDVARYVSRLVVMNHGEKVFDGTPRECSATIRSWRPWAWACPR